MDHDHDNQEIPGDQPIDIWIGRDGRILRVGGGWSAFARDNGGEGLTAEAVVGRPLHRFVADDATRMFVDTLLMAARMTKSPRSFGYRCDSPGLKRHMEMQILPAADGTILCRHRLLRSEAMPLPLRFDWSAGGRIRPLKRCSMCNRIAGADGGWHEPDAAIGGGLVPPDRAVAVIHCVCLECRERVHRQIGKPDRRSGGG